MTELIIKMFKNNYFVSIDKSINHKEKNILKLSIRLQYHPSHKPHNTPYNSVALQRTATNSRLIYK